MLVILEIITFLYQENHILRMLFQRQNSFRIKIFQLEVLIVTPLVKHLYFVNEKMEAQTG